MKLQLMKSVQNLALYLVRPAFLQIIEIFQSVPQVRKSSGAEVWSTSFSQNDYRS